MPAQHTISRRGLRPSSTIVVIAPYGGVGARRRVTMNARRVDRLFAMSAPDVSFPNRGLAASYEQRHPTRSNIYDPGPYTIGGIDSHGVHAGGYMGEDGDAPLIEVFNWRNRSRVGERQRLSENWKQTEKVLAQFLHFGAAESICTCASKHRVEVRLLSFECWATRSMDYCNCPHSTITLIEQGFFPSTPRKPRTAFSIRLLQILHEQSVRGAISKSAWADGLRAVYEYDLKTSLPGFARQVNSYPPLSPRKRH